MHDEKHSQNDLRPKKTATRIETAGDEVVWQNIAQSHMRHDKRDNLSILTVVPYNKIQFNSPKQRIFWRENIRCYRRPRKASIWAVA